MPSSSAELIREPFLVSTEWLAAHASDPTVRILDCRYYFDGRDGRAEYANGHIAGALHLDWSKQLVDPASPQPGTFKLPGPAVLRAVLEPLGISDDTLIVGYDDEGGHFVSRVLATLAAFGYDSVRILEGGLVKWLAEGRPVTSDVATPAPGHLSFDRATVPIFASADDVLAASRDGSAVVLDVRRRAEYTGEEVRAKRGGRVPGAIWALWQENLVWDGDRTFRDAATLRERYARLGLTPEIPVITYCQGGVRAAHTALTLRMLGYDNVRIYDGSWEEWGSRMELPIETGEGQ